MATALRSLFEAQANRETAPRMALRAAHAAFMLEHEHDGKAWAKRATALAPVEKFVGVKPWNYNVVFGDVDGDGDCDYACKGCWKNQTECACAACGTTGPGSYCFACGRELAYSCPKCMAPWAPIPLTEIADAGALRMVRATVEEHRTSDDKRFGIVRAIVSGNVEDDYGTTISPSAIAKRIKPGLCLVDIDHQICAVDCKIPGAGCVEHGGAIDGARCTSVTEAKVPLKDKPGTVDTVIVETTFDLRSKRSKMLYDGICSGKWPELSILFTYTKETDAAVRSGAKKLLGDDDLIDVPAYTFTAKASNPVAKVTEIRTARVLRQRTAAEAIPPIDGAPVVEGSQVVVDPATLAPAPDPLAEAVAAMGKETETSPVTESVAAPAPTATAPETAPAAGGAPALSLEGLQQGLTDLTAKVDAIRTAAASSQELGPRLDALVTTVESTRVAIDATVTANAKALDAMRTTVTKFVQMQIEENKRIKAEIKGLVVPPDRAGHSGASAAEAAEALRSITDTKPAASRAEYELALEDTIAALAVGSPPPARN